jgi:riboflavin synthase alpha subunit
MTQKSKQIAMWVGGSIVGGGLALTIIGMAAQWWISTEVKAQLSNVVIPDTTQITTDVEVIKGSISNIETNVQTALESQQRFEEIFMEYLQNERDN